MLSRRIATLGVIGAFAVAAPVVALPKGTEHFNGASDVVATTEDCGDSGVSLTVQVPTKLWPPNHKFFAPTKFVGDDEANDGLNGIYAEAEGEAGEPIVLVTTGSHNQADLGSGNTDDDIVIYSNEDAARFTSIGTGGMYTEDNTGGGNVVHSDWQARAERDGSDPEGRIYEFTADAYFGEGADERATNQEDADCSVTATFEVPHDMRPSNREAPDGASKPDPSDGRHPSQGKKNS